MKHELVSILELYGLQSANTKLIRNYDNSIYKVEAKKNYALRICSPNTAHQRLESEINWLTRLCRDTDLIVPKPIHNKQGNLITRLKNRCCVLFEWLDGEPVSQNMSTKVANHVGRMMAKLHLHASSYRLDNYTGDRFDDDYFFGSASWWQTKAKKRLQNDYESLVPVINKAKYLIESLKKSPKQYGLIHCDLHFGNVICDRQKYAIIDFASCGMGYYLMDIAVTEAEFKDYTEAEKLISVFRESYQHQRNCVLDYKMIETFEAIASLLFLEWVFENDNEKVRCDKAKWIPEIMKRMRAIT